METTFVHVDTSYTEIDEIILNNSARLLMLEVINSGGGGALTGFKVALKETANSFEDDWLVDADIDEDNENVRRVSTAVHTLAANAQSHLHIILPPVYSVVIYAKSASTSYVQLRGELASFFFDEVTAESSASMLPTIGDTWTYVTGGGSPASGTVTATYNIPTEEFAELLTLKLHIIAASGKGYLTVFTFMRKGDLLHVYDPTAPDDNYGRYVIADYVFGGSVWTITLTSLINAGGVFEDGKTYELSFDGRLKTPTSTTDNTIVRWDGTDGESIQGSGIAVDDSNNMTMPTTAKTLYRDSAIYIQSADDGHLDLTADTSIDLNANTVITGNATPTTDATYNVGSITAKWKRLYLSDPYYYDDFLVCSNTAGVNAGNFIAPFNDTASSQIYTYADTIGGVLQAGPTSVDDNSRTKVTALTMNVSKNTILEARFSISDTTCNFRFGFATASGAVTNSCMVFKYDADSDSTFRCITGDAGSNQDDSSGVNIDTSWHILQIFISSSLVTYYIDGALVSTCSDVNDIETGNLGLMYYIQNRSTGAKILYWDYIKIWQDR